MENQSAMKMVMDSKNEEVNNVTVDSLEYANTSIVPSIPEIDEKLEEFGKVIEQLIEDKVNLNTKNVVTPLVEKSIKKYDKSKIRYIHMFDKSTGDEKGADNTLNISCANEVEVYIISNYLSVINKLIVPKYTTDTINDITSLFNKRCSGLYSIPLILFRALECSQEFLVYTKPSNDNCVFFNDVIDEINDMVDALIKLNNNITIWDKIFRRKTIKAINDIFFTFSMINTTV